MDIKTDASAPDLETQALQYLRLMDMSYSSRQGIPWARRVLEHGRFWSPAPAAQQPERMTPRYCFENCWRASSEDRIYCEGWAVADNRVGLPLLHAWLVNAEGQVLEPTWERVGLIYIGIPVQRSWHHMVSVISGGHNLAEEVNARLIPAELTDWIHPVIAKGRSVLFLSKF